MNFILMLNVLFILGFLVLYSMTILDKPIERQNKLLNIYITAILVILFLEHLIINLTIYKYYYFIEEMFGALGNVTVSIAIPLIVAILLKIFKFHFRKAFFIAFILSYMVINGRYINVSEGNLGIYDYGLKEK